MKMAQAACGGKVAITVEGGHHLNGLRESLKATLKELSGEAILIIFQGKGGNGQYQQLDDN